MGEEEGAEGPENEGGEEGKKEKRGDVAGRLLADITAVLGRGEEGVVVRKRTREAEGEKVGGRMSEELFDLEGDEHGVDDSVRSPKANEARRDGDSPMLPFLAAVVPLAFPQEE